MNKLGTQDWKSGVLFASTVILCGCSGVLHPDPQISTSTAFEPPSAWESAVSFSFADSTYFPDHPYAARIELRIDGHRAQVITGRDLFHGPGGDLRTPWYRVPLPRGGSHPLSLHVVLTDTSGAESAADHPLLVDRDRFYEVHFGVAATRPPRPEAPPLTEGLRGYAVHPTARRQPADSLWISYTDSPYPLCTQISTAGFTRRRGGAEDAEKDKHAVLCVLRSCASPREIQ